jgi:hypothetical protein
MTPGGEPVNKKGTEKNNKDSIIISGVVNAVPGDAVVQNRKVEAAPR